MGGHRECCDRLPIRCDTVCLTSTPRRSAAIKGCIRAYNARLAHLRIQLVRDSGHVGRRLAGQRLPAHARKERVRLNRLTTTRVRLPPTPGMREGRQGVGVTSGQRRQKATGSLAACGAARCRWAAGKDITSNPHLDLGCAAVAAQAVLHRAQQPLYQGPRVGRQLHLRSPATPSAIPSGVCTMPFEVVPCSSKAAGGRSSAVVATSDVSIL